MIERVLLSLGLISVVAAFVMAFVLFVVESRRFTICAGVAGPGADQVHVAGDWCLWRDLDGVWRYRLLDPNGPQDKLVPTGEVVP